VRGGAARSTRPLGHRRRPQHELQHPRGTDGLHARRRGGRVPAAGRRRGGDRPRLRRGARRLGRGGSHARTSRALIGVKDRPASPRAWAAAGGACTLAVVILIPWLLATPAAALRGELRVLQFWSLETCVFLGLAVAVAVLSDLASSIDRRDLAAACALGIAASCLTLALPHRTSRIFYDEQIYQNVARNLADSKRAQLCNDGSVRDGRLECAAAEYNKQPYAWPHVLSLAYRSLGVRPLIPFAVN